MKWSDVAGVVGKAAPLLGTVLGGPAGGAVGGLVAAALGVEQTPEAVQQAAADPAAAAKLRELEERHRYDLEAAHIRAAETSVREVNQTARVEAQSDDAYVRRARPTLVYIVGLIVLLQAVGGIAAVSYGQGDEFASVLRAMMEPLAILCGVIGVYVRSRSTHDKPIAAGKEPPAGLLSMLGGRK